MSENNNLKPIHTYFEERDSVPITAGVYSAVPWGISPPPLPLTDHEVRYNSLSGDHAGQAPTPDKRKGAPA